MFSKLFRNLLVASVFGILLSGCSHAATVNISCTLPAFNDAGNCVASTDSLKDLNIIEIYRQQEGSTDSTMIHRTSVAGREGTPFNVNMLQNEGTYYYWVYFYDFYNNRSCKSNVVSKTIMVSPAKATLTVQ